ncbi:Gfo/Idh/MocA family oxidoreductase [Haloferula sp. BvORR071]|uniref:Gfo/Idh/MocA family protein n=1 Tax=Haloferula sp. BvORR071 TaxID=1396141 RepID=UPI0005525288|nr:Gfo/Idh/MocA family oxidoreductase [Haloferula sp. BvORR071]
MTTLQRRSFLGTTAAAAAFTALRSQAADSPAAPPLKLGLIGCGWWGLIDARAALKAGGVEIIALCDVDSDHLAKAADEIDKLQGSRPKIFKAYEELLDAEGLKAVIIATPPQWHALPFIAACSKGLDIYCEKPLAYDIREGRAMVDAARKAGNIVQIGFQRRHATGFANARKYIQEGKAGRIISAEAQIHYTPATPDPSPVDPPASLDWNQWCGPAPLIPYSPAVGHMNWRLEKTTGQGHLVDWGVHLIDNARWILGLGAPSAVTAAGGLHHLKGKITTPDLLTVHFEFDNFPLTWHQRIWGAQDFDPSTSNGIFLYGEKETVFCTDNKWIVMPRGRDPKPQVQESMNDSSADHLADFLLAVRERRQPACRIEEGFLSTTAVKLAMISYDTGSRIAWDAKSEQISGNPEASKLLKREYRAPWKHPFQG